MLFTRRLNKKNISLMYGVLNVISMRPNFLLNKLKNSYKTFF